MSRTWTPDTVNEDGSKTLRVKRCCDGCGRPLGDITGDELEAAPWADLGPAAHESYRKDAIAAMRALAQLGWAPKAGPA
jgi:hypothetical protein